MNRQGIIGLLTVVCFLASCAGPPPAPPGNRNTGSGSYSLTPDGYYRVRRGDSLHAIAFNFGLDWRSIARWNGISSPYTIYPDQDLRLSPSKAQNSSSSVKIASAQSPTKTTTRSIETPRSSTSSVNVTEEPPASSQSANSSSQVQSRRSKAPAGTSYTTPAGDPGRWLWPTEGKLISSFSANDASRKGIDISGKVGQSVVASAAGQVVYSGNGLIGYGELIIIKHSERMLSAYAHNSKRLVAEGEQVTAGSKIAEMGTNDRNQSVLHFEIRVVGSPQDPLKYLPAMK